MITNELESLESILNSEEVKVLSVDKHLTKNDSNDKIHSLVHLSIVPHFENKIIAHDKVKNNQIEFRKLPSVEVTVALTQGYPSIQKPIMMQTNPIYAAQNDLILEELSNRWSEDVPILYDMVCFI